MAVVPYDKELEAMEEEERQLDLEIAKQEKSQQIAEKRRKLQELSSVGSSSTAAVPTVTRTATLTVKTSKVSSISYCTTYILFGKFILMVHLHRNFFQLF